MYLKEDAAEEMGEEFRTELEIAFGEIIGLLELPKGADLYVMFDSWYCSSDFIGDVNDLDHEVVRRLKKDREETKVSDLAEGPDYDEINVEVRGGKKYLASGLTVKITKFTYFVETIVAIHEIVRTSTLREELAGGLSVYFRI